MNNFDNYFESFFYNSKQNAALIIDFDGTVTAINPAFIRIFGYSEKDLVGKKATVLFTKAGAFGIVNLFNQPEVKKINAANIKANSENQSSTLNKDDRSETVKKVAKIA